jgi:AcrR family transcriptional regulator
MRPSAALECPPEAVLIDDGRSARARKRRDERRTQVLHVARLVFSERGYHAAGIADIIAAAGIARGTFYLYFTNKRAIFDELLDELLAQLNTAVVRISVEEGAPSPIDQMRANVRRVFAALEENRDLTKILLREAVGLDAAFDEKLGAFYGSIVERIQGGLELGQRLGLVRPCDSRVAARSVLGGVKEVVYQALVAGGLRGVSRDALVNEVVDYNLRGLFR